MYITKLLGQSSAAHSELARARARRRRRDRRGYTTGAANTSRAPTRPGNTRSPSPSARPGPHTKHVGNGCHSGCTTTGDAPAAARASASGTAGGASTSTAVGDRFGDHLVAVAQHDALPPSGSTVQRCLERRRPAQRHLRRPRRIAAASSPAVTPPFPRSAGPQKRGGITIVSSAARDVQSCASVDCGSWPRTSSDATTGAEERDDRRAGSPALAATRRSSSRSCGAPRTSTRSTSRSCAAQTGLITLDYGYVNTGATESAITFIDGDAGILRYRGYDIDGARRPASTRRSSRPRGC